MKRKFIASLLLAAVAVAAAGCASNETDISPGDGRSSISSAPPAALSGTLSGGGASSQTAAQEAWRAGFQAAHPGVTVDYDPTGSGTGRTNFSDGGFFFAGSDAPFGQAAASGAFAACAPGSALVEVPAYISPIAVAFNLDGVASLQLDAAVIAQIFTGQINRWDDPAIAAANAGAELPDAAITPVHRSDKSGTTENFTDYLNQVAPGQWPYEAAEEWPAELQGEAAEKTQGVRQTVSSTPGAIGYLDASQAGGLGTAAIKVGSAYVPYSPAAATAAVGQSALQPGRAATDVVVDLDRTLSQGQVYPLVLVSYLAACQRYADPDVGALAKAYLEYVTSAAGQQAAADHAGSAPITADPALAPKVAAAVAAMG
ncbi:MAG: phosphate ABC transporter substrate-binding protein PstS [Propionibacteriaceae bacterium]|nr:phosphate ABC transporter substrate-binding protein PstS [Propionibacteriaceae bacterium]